MSEQLKSSNTRRGLPIALLCAWVSMTSGCIIHKHYPPAADGRYDVESAPSFDERSANLAPASDPPPPVLRRNNDDSRWRTSDDNWVDPLRYEERDEYGRGRLVPGGTLSVEGFWIPNMKVRADRDDHELNGGIEFDAEPNIGPGWGARVSLDSQEQGGFGVFYMTTRHRERVFDEPVRTHTGVIEYLYRARTGGDPIDLIGAAAVGVGGAAFDFDSGFDDTGGAALLGRVQFGVSILDQVDLTVGGGTLIWGYPGETIGRGYFWSLNAGVRF